MVVYYSIFWLLLQEVSTEQYYSELEKLGINVKAKNFLIFQGAVENLSMKTKKELTALFEEGSGSIAFKADYEKCKAELAAAEADLALSYQKKRSNLAGVNKAKLEKKELEGYHKLRDELEHFQLQINLFKIYQCEEIVVHSRKEQEKVREDITANEKSRDQLQRSLDDMKTANLIIPMTRGSMDDIVIQTGSSASSSAAESPIAGGRSVGSSTLPNSQTIYDRDEW